MLRCGFYQGRLGGTYFARSGVALEAGQVGTQIRRALVADVAVLVEGLVNNVFQIDRQGGIHSNCRSRLFVKDRIEQSGGGVTAKRERSCRHLIKHSAKGKQIGAGVQFLPQGLFGGHVSHRAQRAAGAGEMLFRHGRIFAGLRAGRRTDLGQSEVEDLCVAAVGDKKIRRLDVTMHDAFGMSRIERVGDLDTQVNQTVNFEGATQHGFAQSLTFQVLHYDEAQPLMFANFVNGADVGMIQSGSRASFAAKTFQGLRVAGDVVGQEFKGDKAAQRGVLCQVNHTHPTTAELLNNAVMRDGLADHSQGCYGGRAGKSMKAVRFGASQTEVGVTAPLHSKRFRHPAENG